jgi:hypothetical protein
MDCPARIEVVTYDEFGAPVSAEYVACTGTLEGPVVNDASGKVEPVAMGDDTFGSNYYCSTCGQTTVLAHGTVTLGQ